MALVYLNGEIVDEKDAHISVNDRGFVFADGIYEVIRVFDGKPFELERHLDRLERSAAALRLTLDPTAEKIGQIAEDLLDREGGGEAQIYIQVTRGDGAARPRHPGRRRADDVHRDPAGAGSRRRGPEERRRGDHRP